MLKATHNLPGIFALSINQQKQTIMKKLTTTQTQTVNGGGGLYN
jgi:hypothetical protein